MRGLSPPARTLGTRHADRRQAFSLVELVLVVVILATVAAVAVPRVSRSGEEARAAAFARSLRTFADAAVLFHAETGGWPADTHTGTFPSELEGLIDAQSWGAPTAFGGTWDVETNDNGVGCAIGAKFDAAPGAGVLAGLRRVDELLDDGDLDTGAFRRIRPDRFSMVLEGGKGVRTLSSAELKSYRAATPVGSLLRAKPTGD